jgi:hypothetical protein
VFFSAKPPKTGHIFLIYSITLYRTSSLCASISLKSSNYATWKARDRSRLGFSLHRPRLRRALPRTTYRSTGTMCESSISLPQGLYCLRTPSNLKSRNGSTTMYGFTLLRHCTLQRKLDIQFHKARSLTWGAVGLRSVVKRISLYTCDVVKSQPLHALTHPLF